MPSAVLCICALGPQLVELFGKVVQLLEGRAQPSDTGPQWGGGQAGYTLIHTPHLSIPTFLLSS